MQYPSNVGPSSFSGMTLNQPFTGSFDLPFPAWNMQGAAVTGKPSEQVIGVTYKVAVKPLPSDWQTMLREGDVLFGVNTRDTVAEGRNTVMNIGMLNQCLEIAVRQPMLRRLEQEALRNSEYGGTALKRPKSQYDYIATHFPSRLEDFIKRIYYLGNCGQDWKGEGDITSNVMMLNVYAKYRSTMPNVFISQECHMRQAYGPYRGTSVPERMYPTISRGDEVGLIVKTIENYHQYFDCFLNYKEGADKSQITLESPFLQVIPVFRSSGAVLSSTTGCYDKFNAFDIDSNTRRECELVDVAGWDDANFLNTSVSTGKKIIFTNVHQPGWYIPIGKVEDVVGRDPTLREKILGFRTAHGWQQIWANDSYVVLSLSGKAPRPIPLAK